MKTLSPCPLCGAPSAIAHSPFCSARCKDRDMLQWLGEGYRLPGDPLDLDGLDSSGAHD